MKTTKHNPDYKLISKTIQLNKASKVELVYGESNTGENKGLEAYFYKNGLNHFYRSLRYDIDKIPNRWLGELNILSNLVGQCPDGHKLTL